LVRQDVDPFIAKWAFFGAMDELAIQWVLSRKRDRFDLETAAVQVVETFFRGVLTANPQE
jgi:TetR/AcrR family fatty acid metabolism transcriptional regulator